MAEALRDTVVKLKDLVDSWLRSIGAEAKREGRLAGICSSQGNCRNTLCFRILREDGEAETGRSNNMLGFDRVEVEAGVVNLKVINHCVVDLTSVPSRVLVNPGRAHIAEARDGCTCEGQGLRRERLLIDEDTVKRG